MLGWFAACRSKYVELEAGSRAAELAQAWKSAEWRGEPLLVLLAPEEMLARDQRGMAWAYCFEQASPETLAELACCELACATRSEIAAAIPDLDPLPQGEPSAFFLDPVDRSVRGVVSPHPTLPYGEGSLVEWKLDLAPWQAWLAGLAQTLHNCFAPDRGTLDRRAAHQRSKLGATELAELDAHGGVLRAWMDGDLAQTPVMALALVPDAPSAQRAVALGRFARILQERLARKPPRGGSWLERASCGGWVSKRVTDRPTLACGMGACPEPAGRFLSMYTQAERERLDLR